MQRLFGRTKDQLLSELKETAGNMSSLVILMHDANDKQATADVLPQIIEYYMSEGYTFKNYYEIFK
jgi:peptidoglycan/xylan/chitin deacetylase (PgdA/CDA1 family)